MRRCLIPGALDLTLVEKTPPPLDQKRPATFLRAYMSVPHAAEVFSSLGIELLDWREGRPCAQPGQGIHA